jgi:Ca2+-binding EF-hand superfamily protein
MDEMQSPASAKVSMFDRLKNAGQSVKILGHTTGLRASMTLRDREIKAVKLQFGVDIFEVMERNRLNGESTGRVTGGEADAKVVDAYASVVKNMSAFDDIRNRCLADLAKVQELEVPSEPTEENADKPKRKSWNIRSSISNAARSFRSKTELKSELSYMDKEIFACKQAFGVEMYDIMFSLGPEWHPRDMENQELFQKARKTISRPLGVRDTANKEINDLDSIGVIMISHEEIAKFIDANPFLYVMLGVNIGLEEDECKKVATRVAIELTSCKQGKEAMTVPLTKRQFMTFQESFVNDPQGSKEFFHRSVFCAFDHDGNSVLDMKETDQFLDIFYKAGSIFAGDKRLPEKEDLKKLILEELDENGDGMFSFEEIRSLISGSATKDKKSPVSPGGSLGGSLGGPLSESFVELDLTDDKAVESEPVVENAVEEPVEIEQAAEVEPTVEPTVEQVTNENEEGDDEGLAEKGEGEPEQDETAEGAEKEAADEEEIVEEPTLDEPFVEPAVEAVEAVEAV